MTHPPSSGPHQPPGAPGPPPQTGAVPYSQPALRPYIAPSPRPEIATHNAYAREPRIASEQPPQGPPKRPSGWNAPAFGLLAIALALVTVIVWPQMRARNTEDNVRPLVQALAHRDAGARCPRYITSVLTNVGSVSFDGDGNIADRTDLTGPVCDGLRHLYSAGGTAELSCLTSATPCSLEAQRSVVAISVVAHESMHLRGQFDEGRAECESIGESRAIASTLKIPLEQARMISWLHYAAMNPNTPEQYRVSPANCAPVAELEAAPPGDPAQRAALTSQVSDTWAELAS